MTQRFLGGIAVSVLLTCAAWGQAERSELTEARIAEFAGQLVQSLERDDPAAFAAALNGRALFERAIKGLEMPADMRRGLWDGFRALAPQFPAEIGKVLRTGGGRYRFLRARRLDGRWRALFRMTSINGLNYHDLELAAGENGTVRIVDVEVAVTGEPLSQTLRRMWLPAIASANRNQTLAGSESALVTHMHDVELMGQAGRRGDFADALRRYKALPKVLQQDRTVMTIGIVYAGAAGESDLRLQMMQDYARLHPGSPNADLMSIDACMLQKQWDDALEAVNRVDKNLGGDPYLDQRRGDVAYARGDHATAAKLWRKVIASDPTIPDPYYSLIEVALVARQWDETTVLLLALQRDAAMVIPDLTQNVTFGEYVKTQDYQQYLKQIAKTVGMIPQAQPLLQALEAALAGDEERFRSAFSQEMQRRLAGRWAEGMAAYKSILEKEFKGDFSAVPLHYKGDANAGDVHMPRGRIRVVNEDGTWKLDER